MISVFLGFASCKGGDEPDLQSGRVILIYAVAANNLSTNLIYDTREILNVAPKLDLSHNAVLLYSVIPTGECKLQKLVKDKSSGEYKFTLVKSYNPTPLSVEKERIEDVLDYVDRNFNTPRKGLILWSHATGWIPWFGGSTGRSERREAFGQDNYEGVGYQCNITTLAEAIPAGKFDFIWFDCCYMANIETIYQLRDKTDRIVAYVSEIDSDGMPYDLTMPYLLRAEPDLQQAAYEVYDYYMSRPRAVTISIMDTAGLQNLAEAASKIFQYGTPPTWLGNIHNYSRLSNSGPFYDMGELLDSYTGVPQEYMAAFHDAMEEVVVYKKASTFDFSSQWINQQTYSGLTMHHYVDNGTANEIFYTGLDWYEATRK